MSTRAVYTVKDSADTFHVYIHCDGYPSGAADNIAAAVPFAWELPRFEAMDFAAAIIRGNKTRGGNVYCTSGYDAHGDLAYRYEITHGADGLHVRAFEREWSGSFDESRYTQIFAGTLAAFTKFAAKERA